MTIKGCDKKRYKTGKNDYKTLQTNMSCGKKTPKENCHVKQCKIL